MYRGNMAYCECGCGKQFEDHKNHRGQYVRFIKGHMPKGKNHYFYGGKLSQENKDIISNARSGSKHHLWKGDDVKNSSLHTWIRRHLPQTPKCQICNTNAPTEVSNISTRYNKSTYNRSFENWRWLCCGCHRMYDKVRSVTVF